MVTPVLSGFKGRLQNWFLQQLASAAHFVNIIRFKLIAFVSQKFQALYVVNMRRIVKQLFLAERPRKNGVQRHIDRMTEMRREVVAHRNGMNQFARQVDAYLTVFHLRDSLVAAYQSDAYRSGGRRPSLSPSFAVARVNRTRYLGLGYMDSALVFD
jgi:hypothetical protein